MAESALPEGLAGGGLQQVATLPQVSEGGADSCFVCGACRFIEIVIEIHSVDVLMVLCVSMGVCVCPEQHGRYRCSSHFGRDDLRFVEIAKR